MICHPERGPECGPTRDLLLVQVAKSEERSFASFRMTATKLAMAKLWLAAKAMAAKCMARARSAARC